MMTSAIERAAEALSETRLPSGGFAQLNPVQANVLARAVFESIDRDELARWYWNRWNPSGPTWKATNEASRNESRLEADALKAHLTGATS